MAVTRVGLYVPSGARLGPVGRWPVDRPAVGRRPPPPDDSQAGNWINLT